jgi:hypothetical protein
MAPSLYVRLGRRHADRPGSVIPGLSTARSYLASQISHGEKAGTYPLRRNRLVEWTRYGFPRLPPFILLIVPASSRPR